ncbi:MAG TPA: pyrimidine dimer DNA glycosylase/endonuclease V [Microbacteriaceae bacterium]|nr:pyrimidine dimer DNA glycosylase/endonuclease V [Microbacteriaceae bacterium]
MRIWSMHPRQLDRVALVACWRESLLAQAVLAGRTRGYKHHPQLDRFRAQDEPGERIGAYLVGLADEADRRGYRFDRSRIDRPSPPLPVMPLTQVELDAEWHHLLGKLEGRSPDDWERWRIAAPEPHPLFRLEAPHRAD